MYIKKYNFKVKDETRELIFDSKLNIIIGQYHTGKRRLLHELKLSIHPDNKALDWTDKYQLISNLITGFPIKANSLEEGACFVNLIENGYHPNQQRVLIPKLLEQFPKVQFFISTYSPFIVQSAGKGQVISLDGIDLYDVDFSKLSIESVLDLAFNMDSRYSPETQEKIDEYDTLIKKIERTPQEEKQLKKVQSFIRETDLSGRRPSDELDNLNARIEAFIEANLPK